MDKLIGRTIKGYKLQEQIGSGGFGAVYKAYQGSVGREVAIKFILPDHANQPEFIRRFETEAQLVARLEHPHIVPLYDYWRDADGAYLVMRWLRGGSLKEVLEEEALDLEEAARLLNQLTSALELAHRHEVIHRDIKPGNILLDEDGNAYLADFGIAKDLTQLHNSVTQADAVVGSLDYLSPEQAHGETVTPRTDQYSLGVVLYEVLTAQHPFHEFTSVERLYKHINDPLPLITTLNSTIQDAINDVIQKATEKNPQNRYADINALAHAFSNAAGLAGATVESNAIMALTPRELEVLQLLVDGKSNSEIAEELVVTPATVKWHIRQVYRKLGVRSRVQAIVRAQEMKLVSDGRVQPVIPVSTVSYLPDLDNPYKGLHAFEAADFRDFFGRELLVEKLLKRMAEDEEGSRFLAVVGPSGSGKSSVVKAGLIPALWQGKVTNSETWYIVEMLPGARPLDELEVALTRIAGEGAVGNLREHLDRDAYGLTRLSQLILPDDDSELMIVVDQFEEVFTLVEDEADRQHYLDLLHAAVTDPRSRVRVVITLRADFYDQPLHYPAFGELVRSRMETVLPLSAQELERAIVGPADRVGIVFEEGLVATIVSEMTYQAGVLPLVQYALTELFEEREDRLLTHRAYQKLGGAVGALAQRAEDIYRELGEDAQATVQQLFLRLVTLGEGAEDTRRRVARTELLAATVPELMDEVIDTYAAYRLLSLDNDPGTREPTIEVAHEAILREWVRLRNWLDEGRDDIRLQRQLTHAATEWREANQDPSFLLRGTRLETFAAWTKVTPLSLTGDERSFLETSLYERDERRRIEEARKEHEAALEQQSVNRLRYLVIVLLVAVIVAGGLSLFAFDRESQALEARSTSDANAATAIVAQGNAEIAVATSERRADETQSLLLSNTAQQAFDRGDPFLALALAVEANRVALPNPPALSQRTLANIAYPLSASQRFVGHSNIITSVANSPDGRLALSGSLDKTVILWDIASGERLQTFVGHENAVTQVAFNPNGNTALSGSDDTTLILWDLASGEALRVFNGHSDGVTNITFSPDGTRAISASCGQRGDDNTCTQAYLILWDVATGEQVQTFIGHSSIVTSMVFSPDGNEVLTSSGDNTIILWNMASGLQVRRFIGHSDWVRSVIFSPDSTTALSGSNDGTLILWDVASGDVLRTFEGQHTGTILSLTFGSDGKSVLSGALDGKVIRWDIGTGQPLSIMSSFNNALQMEFSPDGNAVLTGFWDGTVLLEHVTPGDTLQTFQGHLSPVNSVAISPDGMTALSSADFDPTLTLWDVASGEILRTFIGHDSQVQSVTFSPDDNTAISGSADNSLILWDVDTGEELRRFSGHTDWVQSVAFSPDGKTVISGSNDNTLILWDVASGEALRILTGHTNKVTSVTFSPDGKTVISGSCGQKSQLICVQGQLILWDVASVASGTPLQSFIGHTDDVTSVAFSPDGNTVISSSADNTLILWDMASGGQVRTFVGHSGIVSSVTFSPDGKFALSGSDDGILILWEVASGEILRTFTGHSSWVSSAVISPDGKFALSGSGDGTLKLWRIDTPEELIAWTVANRAVPRLTCDERRSFGVTPFCDAQGNAPTRTSIPTLAPSSTATSLPKTNLTQTTRTPTFVTRTATATATPNPLPTATPPPFYEVVAPARDIPVGTTITQEDVMLVPYMWNLIPQTALTDITQAVGKTARYDIECGQQIIPEMLGSSTDEVVYDATNISQPLACEYSLSMKLPLEMREVVIITQAGFKGTLIEPHMVTLWLIPRGYSLRNAFSDLEEVIGRQLIHNVYREQVLTSSMFVPVEAPTLPPPPSHTPTPSPTVLATDTPDAFALASFETATALAHLLATPRALTTATPIHISPLDMTSTAITNLNATTFAQITQTAAAATPGD